MLAQRQIPDKDSEISELAALVAELDLSRDLARCHFSHAINRGVDLITKPVITVKNQT